MRGRFKNQSLRKFNNEWLEQRVNLERKPRRAVRNRESKQERLRSESQCVLVEYQGKKPDCWWKKSAMYGAGVNECKLSGADCL